MLLSVRSGRFCTPLDDPRELCSRSAKATFEAGFKDLPDELLSIVIRFGSGSSMHFLVIGKICIPWVHV